MTNDKNKSAKPEKKPNPNVGHRDRLKERYSKVGFDGLSEHEALELLLFYAIPQKDTKPIAKALLAHFGTLASVFDAGKEQLELANIKGLTPNSITLLTMIVPLFHEYSKKPADSVTLNCSDDSGKFLVKYYAGVLTERVTVICIDGTGKILNFETVCEGDSTNVVLNCRRLVEIVMKFPKTAGIIIAHNHPGGLALPSLDDISSTNELLRLLKNMNINLIDHFIIADGEYISLACSESFKNVFKYI